MRLDLLWFRHQRPPRPHVAEKGYASIFDMSNMITLLDPGESFFTRMLAGQWVTRDVETREGEYFVQDGKWRKAHKVEEVDSDDWFEPTRWRVQIVPSSTFLTNQGGVKVNWLEDELFPRIATVEATDNPVFRKGDIVNIIAGQPKGGSK